MYKTKIELVGMSDINKFIAITTKLPGIIKLTDGDKLVLVSAIKDKQSIVLISKAKMCVVFECASAKLLKKNSVGIIGMKFDKNDFVAYATATDEFGVFTFDEREYNVNSLDAGKRATKGRPIK